MEETDKSGQPNPKNRECVEAEDGRFYQWDPKKEKWYFYDPIRKRRLGGCPRKTLPIASEKGLTARGKPRQRETKKNRALTRSDSQKTYKAAHERKRRKHKKLNNEIRRQESKLEKVEKKLSEAELLQQMIADAPSVREQRKAILTLFTKKGFSPIAELIEMLQSPRYEDVLPLRDRIQILKILAEFEAPKPKTVDIEGEMKNSMVIQVVDYAKMSQKALKDEVIEVETTAGEEMELTDDDYAEFETEVT